jgi:hypothetical protein
MGRVSWLLECFGADPFRVRMALGPAVLLWQDAPCESTPCFEQGLEVRDPLVLPLQPRGAGGWADGPGKALTVGRRQANDLVLAHPKVSRLHAYILEDPQGGFLLFDAQGSRGTRCDERVVRPGRGAKLRDGSRIVLGEVLLLFYLAGTFEEFWLRPHLPRPCPPAPAW